MDHVLSWAIPIAVTAGVLVFVHGRQRLAAARGTDTLPAHPYFTIPDDTALPGTRNAHLVLTTWDIVKRNFAEATLKSADIGFTVVEASAESGDEVWRGPACQIFVPDEDRAAEARRILRECLTRPADPDKNIETGERDAG
jgi:hypothetical protein